PAGVQIVDPKRHRATGAVLALSGSVEPKLHGPCLELGPVVARSIQEPKTQHVLVEGHRSFHVGDEEVDEIGPLQPAHIPSSFPSTITAADVVGTPRPLWARATYAPSPPLWPGARSPPPPCRSPAPPRSCSTHSRSRARPFASNRFPWPREPPETFTGSSPSASSAPPSSISASSPAVPNPRASRCWSSLNAKTSSTSARSISSPGSSTRAIA